MDKPTKPTDLMPRTFGGLKENYSTSLQQNGVEPNVPVIYHGKNFNYEKNAIGQELDYCEKIVDFINGIPIGKTITVDSNNKLQYADLTQEVPIATTETAGIVKPDGETITVDENGVISAEGGATRNIGEIIPSTIPLTDAGLHLLDGALISGSGSYSAFVDYIASLYVPNTVGDFVQPVLSADGGLGGNSFAVSTNVPMIVETWGAYLAFRGFAQSQATDPIFHSTQNNVTGYIDMYNPLPLNITSIKIYNQLVDNRASSAGKIYGSNDGTNWTQLTTYSNSNQSSGGIWTISLSSNSNYYKYYRMESTAGGSGGYWSIAEIELTATYLGYPEFFCTEAQWQDAVTKTGICDKFVYDSVNNTVRIPRYGRQTVVNLSMPSVVPSKGNGKTLGLTNGTVNCGLGTVSNGTGYLIPNTDTYGKNIQATIYSSSESTGAFGITTNGGNSGIVTDLSTLSAQKLNIYYYIVLATSAKTDIEVDIDQIATDLNGKADVDLSNTTPSQSFINMSINWGMPDYSAGISISSSPYTAPSDGVIIWWQPGETNNEVNLYVNSHLVYQKGIGSYSGRGFATYLPVSKNDIFTYSGWETNAQIVTFYPLKGV